MWRCAALFLLVAVQGDELKPDAVLGYAEGYGWDKLRPFVKTLRVTANFTGDCVLFVSRHAIQPNEDWLKQYRVTAQYIDESQFHREHGHWHPSSRRYGVMLEFLKARPNAYNKILTIDTRDTFFQSEPFAQIHFPEGGPQLLLVGEGKRTDNWNQDMVRGIYGTELEQKFCAQDKLEITCSGTTVGTQASIECYLQAFVEESTRTGKFGHAEDQPTSQMLLGSGRLSHCHAAVCARDTCPIQNHGMTAFWFDPECPQAVVVPTTGNLAAVVHQFDRLGHLCALYYDNVGHHAPEDVWSNYRQKPHWENGLALTVTFCNSPIVKPLDLQGDQRLKTPSGLCVTFRHGRASVYECLDGGILNPNQQKWTQEPASEKGERDVFRLKNHFTNLCLHASHEEGMLHDGKCETGTRFRWTSDRKLEFVDFHRLVHFRHRLIAESGGVGDKEQFCVATGWRVKPSNCAKRYNIAHFGPKDGS